MTAGEALPVVGFFTDGDAPPTMSPLGLPRGSRVIIPYFGGVPRVGEAESVFPDACFLRNDRGTNPC